MKPNAVQGNALKNSESKSVKVLKVEFVGFADVYNLEVEDTHAFAVNGGLIVHNCGDATRYRLSYAAPQIGSFETGVPDND
jgi:hypothetical protein